MKRVLKVAGIATITLRMRKKGKRIPYHKRKRGEEMKIKSNTKKKYEYTAHYYRNGRMVCKSTERWDRLEEAKWDNLYCRGGETIVFARREVGEWEEIPK